MKHLPAFLLGLAVAAVAYFAMNALRPAPDDQTGMYQAALRTVALQRDSVIRAADSARLATAHQDSVTAVERARLASERDAAQGRAQAATAQAAAARASHVATLDSMQTVAFAAYEAARDSVDAAKDVTIAALEVEVGLLAQQVTTWKGLVTATEAERDIARVEGGLERTFREAEGRRAARATRERNLAILVNVAQLGERIYSKVAS